MCTCVILLIDNKTTHYGEVIMKNIKCIFCNNDHNSKFVSTPTQSGFTCYTCYDLIQQERSLQQKDCGLLGIIKTIAGFIISLYGSIIALGCILSFPGLSLAAIAICFIAQQYFYKRNVAWFTKR